MRRMCKGDKYAMSDPTKESVKREVKDMMTNKDRKFKRAKKGKLA